MTIFLISINLKYIWQINAEICEAKAWKERENHKEEKGYFYTIDGLSD